MRDHGSNLGKLEPRLSWESCENVPFSLLLTLLVKEPPDMVVSSQSSRKLNLSPGLIVTCRDRRWVVLPSDNRELIRLRPLSGSEDRICGLYRPLIGKLESIESAEFPLPKTEVCQDSTAAHLLMNFVGDYNHPILAYGKFWLSRVYQNQPR